MFKVYSKDDCAYCTYAKNLLLQKGEVFEEYDVYEKLDELTEAIGHKPRTVPQIFHDDQYVGGYEELVNYMRGK